MRNKFLVFFLLASIGLGAQDIHFSQFYASPLTLNPAMTGFLNGDCRAGVMYRNQWKSVTVPFITISGAYEHKFLMNNGDQVGAGVVVVSDQSGDANFRILKYRSRNRLDQGKNLSRPLTIIIKQGEDPGGSGRGR